MDHMWKQQDTKMLVLLTVSYVMKDEIYHKIFYIVDLKDHEMPK